MKQRSDTWIGRCTECGKLCFTSRKLAKQYLIRKFPQDKMTVYKCPYRPEYFHFGHTPYPVRRGWASRGMKKANHGSS